MAQVGAKLVGVELYFDDLPRAKHFYADTLGLRIAEDEPEHHAKFEGGNNFLCLEKRGVESYPSRDKAVLFFEVPDLAGAIRSLGQRTMIQQGPNWAVLHDPEGHNVILLQSAENS